ncbi:MAG: 2Fe-2S iron-sulfur cluster binding domain-containing protein [Rhodobacteraceae bacterium]|nr:2Fe-2S iron-sulfur cluster binding domain-containing protein [Paracoccaceae bacterium]
MVKITKHPDGPEFDCAEGDTILRAALRAGVGMSYSCNVGSCGNCRFELIEGEVEHLRKDAPAWSERDLKRNRWLGCQAQPKGECRIKFREDPGAISPDTPEHRTAELVSVTPVTHDISEFAFRVDGTDSYSPGQYALITAPGIEGGRAYSMSRLAGDGTWRFMIRKVPGGAATGHLFEAAKPGDTLSIDGPYGTGWLREDCPRDIVLIAGGSGLSPMVSIAEGAAAAGMLGDRRLHFFYGCRTEDDLFNPEDILGAEIAGKTSFTAALSEPGSGWTGPTGFIHDVVRDTLGEAIAEAEIYFAGPAVMSASIQKMAHEAGVPMDRLHFDEFY